MKKYIGMLLKLKEMPQQRFGSANIKIGGMYKIIDVEGSNFWFIDDDGNQSSCSSSRFELN